MKSQQSGFTLIELVMVIVILGILAASAIPKFVDVSSDAQQAAVEGIAGSLGSASAINYAVRSIKATNGSQVTNCDQVAGTLAGGALPAGYAMKDDGAATPAPVSIPAGSSVPCTVVHTASTLEADFVGHGIL